MKAAYKAVLIYLIIFLAGELFIRLFLPEYRSLHHGTGVTGGIPFKLNSYGLRDYDYDFNKNDKYRILFLGDSITFGLQNRLEDIYPKVLERLMNTDNKNRYQLINAGGVAGNPYFQYEYLKGQGITFNPDYVILGLCLNDIGNCYMLKKEKKISPDFWKDRKDTKPYKYALKWNKDLPLAKNLKIQLNKLRWIARSKSYLYSFIDVNLLRFAYRTGMKKFSFDMYGEREQLLAFGIDDSSEEAWKLLFVSLIEIRDFLVRKNIGFMIVVFPYEFQLSDDIKDNFFNIDKSKFTINPQARLTDFCKKNNIEMLDLLPDYKKSNKRLFFPLDYYHPNVYGHRIAAERLYVVLKDNFK